MKQADHDYYQGKIIVITGASSGIGRDLAAYLAPAKVSLVLMARRVEALEELARECRAAGSEALVLPGDVASRAGMETAASQVLGELGVPDIVIGNAGVGGLNPARGFDMDIHERTMAINVLGLAYTLMPYVPAMVERGSGHLVGISSLAAFRGLPCAGSYSPSKAAQAVFMESLRVDLRPHGIACTSIHPGFVETPMTAHEDFKMPFKVPVRKSSMLVAAALRKRKSVYLYPWQMRILTWCNRVMPNWLFDRLLPLLGGQNPESQAKLL